MCGSRCPHHQSQGQGPCGTGKQCCRRCRCAASSLRSASPAARPVSPWSALALAGAGFSRALARAAGAGRSNDSCVVQISDGRHRLLLSGDIEQEAERRLLALGEQGRGRRVRQHICQYSLQHPRQRRAGEPHHGSRTSSTPGFVAAVNPDVVIHSAGDRNQWQFPPPRGGGEIPGRPSVGDGQDGAILIEAGRPGSRSGPSASRAPGTGAMATGGSPGYGAWTLPRPLFPFGMGLGHGNAWCNPTLWLGQ